MSVESDENPIATEDANVIKCVFFHSVFFLLSDQSVFLPFYNQSNLHSSFALNSVKIPLSLFFDTKWQHVYFHGYSLTRCSKLCFVSQSSDNQVLDSEQITYLRFQFIDWEKISQLLNWSVESVGVLHIFELKGGIGVQERLQKSEGGVQGNAGNLVLNANHFFVCWKGMQGIFVRPKR